MSTICQGRLKYYLFYVKRSSSLSESWYKIFLQEMGVFL